MRDKGAGQNVAFYRNGRAVMHCGTVGSRQPVKADRRLIPAVHLHAFHIVQQLAAVQHRDWITKAESLGSYVCVFRRHIFCWRCAG
ncbi:hypothetical protein SEEN554_22610 [Salmonella enterica subsp. enterica serovar Newport str. CVM 21554]|nr:hypothetical protein CS37_13370 [Salmonella enterica subsp. enterica serovar Enteritidis]AHW05394.1 hypothetical protein SEEE0968_07195 [Salmonella enterica subsp. enterica serovar Enteritidis str. CDC_2010K_0968]AHZ07940.1 hypothetical protein SEEE1427_21130 [Salmonella enterica subsp. enterica serovar Enteritidis str. 77-1427]AIT51732.1 hypothetical protein SEEN554_22610 [Salmonella enterica subsp. enterica serovar Newport str. CVM 21554]